MFKRKKNIIKHFLTILIKILNDENNSQIHYQSLNFIFILFYFAQIFSFIYKFQNHFKDDKLTFLAKSVLYSNFSNILFYINNQILAFLSYFFTQILLSFFYGYIIFIMLTKKNFNFLNVIYVFLFRIYFWILLIPFLEILSHPLICSFEKTVFCPEKTNVFINILSIYGIILAISLGMLHLWVSRDYFFLELHEIKLKASISTFLCYYIRIAFPLFFPFLTKDSEFLYYLILYAIGFISFFDYYQNFPIRSPILNKLYIIILFIFNGSLLNMTLYKSFSFILVDDVFVLILLLGVMFAKLGSLQFERMYNVIISGNFENKTCFIYGFEEMLLLFQNKKNKNRSKILFLGIISHHSKYCKQEKCKLKSGKSLNFFELEEKQQKLRIFSFINHKITERIEKNRKGNQDNEELLFKYLTFLMNFNVNFTSTYYNLQKINSNFSNKSFYASILFKIFIKKMNTKIKNIQNEQNFLNNSETVNTSTFLKISKRKLHFENNMRTLLKSRIAFWNKFKEGFSSYEEIIKNLYSEMSKVSKFHKILEPKLKEESFEENMITLKFSSIYNSIILNHVHQAIKIEDQLEKIKHKILKVNKNESSLSIFEENLIICEASFLKTEGIILEASKNEKNAIFFGYDLQEIKLIKTVKELMPSLFAKHHEQFIRFNLSNKQKNNLIGKSLGSFAKNKKRFLFPVKMYLGFSIQYYNDFVIHTAIIKQPADCLQALLFEKNGMILGCTEEFFNIYKEIYPELLIENFELLNFYNLLTKLQDTLKENLKENHENLILRNMNGELLFPFNLEEIIELIKFKKNEVIEEEKNLSNIHISFNSMKTLDRSMGSNVSKIKMNKFFHKYNKNHENGTLNLKKETLIRYFTEFEQDFFLLNDLMNTKNMKRRAIVYDMKYSMHRFGKGPSDLITVFWLKIVNIGEIETECLQNENLANSEISFLENRLQPNNLTIFEKSHIVTVLNIENPIIRPNDQENQKIANICLLEVPKSDDKIKRKHSSKENRSSHQEDLIKENIDIKSQSTSISALKKGQMIFETIKLLQGNSPISLIIFIFFLLLEILLILTYGLAIFSFCANYISLFYEPLQTISMNQCRTNLGIDLAALIFGEFEYELHNISTLSNFQKKEMERIMKRTYKNAKNMFYQDRNREYSFSFGNYLQIIYGPFIDYRNPSKIKKILLPDLTDFFLQLLYNFFNDENSRTKENLKIIIRNFPYYASATRAFREIMQREFVNTNKTVSSNILMAMIVMGSIIALTKIIELFIANAFYVKIRKLVNIFMRINVKDVDDEMSFLQDVLNISLSSKQSYFNCNYPDLRSVKKSILNDDVSTSTKGKKNLIVEKVKKKTSFLHLRNISRMNVLFFLSFNFIMEFGFFFGAYYFWRNNNENILKLIEINTNFNDLYTFTTTDLNNQAFIVREKIFEDLEYQASNEKLQVRKTRLIYFDTRYIDRLNLLKKYVADLPSYAIAAQDVINDVIYDELMEGNTCNVLKIHGIIETDQIVFCEGIFDGSLKKGIIAAMNQLTLYLSNRKNISAIINESNKEAVKKQLEEIYLFLKEPLHSDVVIVDYYLSESLYLFYSYLSGHYSRVLYQQIDYFNTFIWIFCLGDMALLIIASILLWKFFYQVYKYVAWSMAIIPYGKIVNDEQTIFLIKNFWKQRNKI